MKLSLVVGTFSCLHLISGQVAQSEGTEVFYRNIQIKWIAKLHAGSGKKTDIITYPIATPFSYS